MEVRPERSDIKHKKETAERDTQRPGLIELAVLGDVLSDLSPPHPGRL